MGESKVMRDNNIPLERFYQIGPKPWEKVNSVEYHTPEWEILVETGWVTLYVTYNHGINIAYMGKSSE